MKVLKHQAYRHSTQFRAGNNTQITESIPQKNTKALRLKRTGALKRDKDDRNIKRMVGNKKAHHKMGFKNMARPARFERATAWFVARYSIQLSYGRVGWSILRYQTGKSIGY